MKRHKKIFDLSYWTGLYDQNCRNYHSFYIVGHTGPMVTRYTGRLPVVEMSREKKSKKKPGVLNNFCFLFNFKISNIDGPCDTYSPLCLGVWGGRWVGSPSNFIIKQSPNPWILGLEILNLDFRLVTLIMHLKYRKHLVSSFKRYFTYLQIIPCPIPCRILTHHWNKQIDNKSNTEMFTAT